MAEDEAPGIRRVGRSRRGPGVALLLPYGALVAIGIWMWAVAGPFVLGLPLARAWQLGLALAFGVPLFVLSAAVRPQDPLREAALAAWLVVPLVPLCAFFGLLAFPPGTGLERGALRAMPLLVSPVTAAAGTFALLAGAALFWARRVATAEPDEA